MNTFLFVEQSPNPLAIKFVFKDLFLDKEAMVYDKSMKNFESWLQPFWDLSYVQQIYIAKNFVVFIHQFLEKKTDSHLSPWTEKTQEVQSLLSHIPFPLNIQKKQKEEHLIDLESIQEWLDKFIRKATWIHGGAFQAIKLEEGVLYLRPDGACYQCPYLGMTVYKGILEPISLQFPEIKNIELVYDHFSAH